MRGGGVGAPPPHKKSIVIRSSKMSALRFVSACSYAKPSDACGDSSHRAPIPAQITVEPDTSLDPRFA